MYNTVRVIWKICAVMLLSSLGGCDGDKEVANAQAEQISMSPAPSAIPAFENLAAPSEYNTQNAGSVSLRRLTRTQFKNVIRDLFSPAIVVPKILEPDVPKIGLLNVGASDVSYSPRGVESIESASFVIAEQVIADDEIYQQLFGCQIESDACLEMSFIRLASKAFRRMVNADEVEPLIAVVRRAEEVVDSTREALQFGIAGILQSPHFLFRTELGYAQDTERRFDDYEMASRLSFFLWNTMPDDALFELAKNNALSTREDVYNAALTMMASWKFREGVKAFFDDYLELYELQHLTKDPKVFEHFDAELGPAAAEETWRLIEDLVLKTPTDFRDIMTADYTFVNPRLAAIYAVPAPSPEGFARLPLTAKDERRGLLGHVSFLALHSHSTATSATRRGEAVRKRLLCQSIPSPPVNVDTSIPEPSGDRLTLRDRVAEHLEDPSCVGCHQLTDPIGLGLENYDSIGRYRTHDNGALIDPSGELDTVYFDDPLELGERIREHDAFAPCLVKMLVRYAIGRDVSSDERDWFRTLVDRFEIHGHLIQPLFLELVTSPIFIRAGDPLEIEQ